MTQAAWASSTQSVRPARNPLILGEDAGFTGIAPLSSVAPGRFVISGGAAKLISHNIATTGDGGGVWVARDAEMQMLAGADNLSITHNRASYGMGGGIFTADYCYSNPLRRVPPLDVGETIAYGNLTLYDVEFYGNIAYEIYTPPSNWSVLTHLLPFDGTSQPGSTPTAQIHPLNNNDINFLGGGVLFEFFKTDHRLLTMAEGGDPMNYLLAGAQFMVFRRPAPTGDDPALGTSDNYLVTITNGQPNTPWEAVEMEVSTSESGSNATPLSFNMSPGFIYQLVEAIVPQGFQRPFGQWRLWVSDTHASGFEWEIVGAPPTPSLVNLPCNCEESIPNCEDHVQWFLPNWPENQLPLTGGTGRGASSTGIPMYVTGTALLLLAAIAALAIQAHTKRGKARQTRQI